MIPPIVEEINELKKQRKALILAHFYEDGQIQDIADFVGDSLFLAQKGAQTDAEVILLAGVVFMAESVKILSPEKTVLAPDLNAGCSLVQLSPTKKYLNWREQYPDHICMTYINSSAEVKAISDVICTSSNAEKILKSIPENRPILFGPDKHLGKYLSKKYQREMKLWDGSCEVHELFSSKELFKIKQQYPKAVVLAHPECHDAVLELADVVGSTSRLLEEVRVNSANQFIVATEEGIFHQMKKVRPAVELIQAPTSESCGCNHCPYMKLNTLEKIRDALKTLSPAIELPGNLIKDASISLNQMMLITEDKNVSWPEKFKTPKSLSI